jgi:hypothetical protein
MKRNSLIVAALVTCLAGVVPLTANAQNADPTARAQFLGALKRTSKKTATLRVRYRCAPPAAGQEQALWVSAKQSKNGRRRNSLSKEGASKQSTTWLQSHRNQFTCDGSFHTATFRIDKVEKGSKGRLKKGRAYIQFCVTQGEQTLLLSKSGWVRVR